MTTEHRTSMMVCGNLYAESIQALHGIQIKMYQTCVFDKPIVNIKAVDSNSKYSGGCYTTDIF